ncbi:thermonuclease family protein [Paenibacillus sp. MAH-36]|uniref:Thermonuclease family protein n=1 Tax=Paenibacillus violae TaxID=3077234 RepID=A0ABU3RE47_9BACL|nr:thermonuclease family protein [Paenibacillus sp. PFR10]MDU0202560.1 thermonuclease family protein [Paenibacillus sp. PFR10]
MLHEKFKKVLISSIVLIVFIVTGCSQQTAVPTAVSPSPSASTTTASALANSKMIPAKIVRVVDGDTMKVSFQESGKVKEETIRLLLVDTPESVAPDKPVQPFALEASKFAKDTLNDKDVRLELDVSERDKYGRLLCYLYIGDKMFNEMLLENGYARVAYIYPPNVKYVDKFREIQKEAQLKGVNIWSVENYAQEDGFHENAVKAKPSPSAAATAVPTTTAPMPSPAVKPAPTTESNVIYNSCAEAKAAGVYNIKRGQPGYSSKLDKDNDGVACEK